MHSSSSPLVRHRRGHASLVEVILVTLALAALLAACGGTSSGGTTTSGVTINVKVVHGQDNSTLVVLPVTINGHGPYAFALDTGAATSLIDTPVAQQLGLPQNGSPNPIAGVSGQEQSIPVLVNSWSIEKIKLPKMTVQSASLFSSQRGAGLQGLIGSDIWNRFGKFTLNYSSGTLTVPKQIVTGGKSTPTAFFSVPGAAALPPDHTAASLIPLASRRPVSAGLTARQTTVTYRSY